MSRHLYRPAALLAVFTAVFGMAAPRVSADSSQPDPMSTSSSEIPSVDFPVQFDDGQDIGIAVDSLLRKISAPASHRDCPEAHTFNPDPEGRCHFIYEDAITGAWLLLTPDEADEAEQVAQSIPGVLNANRAFDVMVDPDYFPNGIPGVPTNGPQVASTGYQRIQAVPGGDYANVNIAILDTGVDAFNDDLNVVGGFNCTGDERGPDGWGIDDYGHGTFTDSQIAAKDNDRGALGLAAGAPTESVPVLSQGYGSMASILCGVDWVAWTLHDDDPTNDVQFVNLSLGGPNLPSACGSWDALHNAFCNVADMGVVFSVSAGNDAVDAIQMSPANYAESVLTVSALTDWDGLPGGLAAPAADVPSSYVDDTRALFSDYGSIIDFIAPGVYIYGSLPLNQTGWLSGTSMAAPMVTGALAAHASQCGVSAQASVVDVLRWSTQPGWTQIDGRWGGDVGPDHEPMLRFLADCPAR